jgi:hypothetical protein
MRPSLRISKTPEAWRWYFEDMDAPAESALWEESGDFPSWQAAEAAARAAHPTVERVWVHAVRGWGVAFEDSLPMLGVWP